MSFDVAVLASDSQPLEQLTAWVANGIWGGDHDFGPCLGMAVVDGETLIAGVILHDYEKSAGIIQISAYATDKRWMSRSVLKRLFGLIFIELKCQLAVARISSKNKPLRRIFKAFGFTAYEIPRLRGRHEGEIVFTLTDDQYRQNRIVGGRNGQS